jgi:hypothetical protein
MFRLLFDLNPIVCSLGRYEQDILQGTERVVVSLSIHLSGQLYILSKDFAIGVVAVAQLSLSGKAIDEYSAGIKVHDIRAMTYLSNEDKAMNLIQLSESSAFWRHGVKSKRKQWKEIWTNEINRTKRA